MLVSMVAPNAPAELRTARTRLRGWQPADRVPFAALNADPEVMAQFLRPLSRGESDELMARSEADLRARGWGRWALELRTKGTFAGMVGLDWATFEAPFTPAVEIGWRLARASWGQGLATEAARAVLDHAFGVLGMEEIVSFTACTNLRSQRVMERLGMRRDPGDDFERPEVPVGHPLRPHVLYRIARPPAGRP
jgi:ribosomal-protein-alanine N-acetyltransferase